MIKDTWKHFKTFEEDWYVDDVADFSRRLKGRNSSIESKSRELRNFINVPF